MKIYGQMGVQTEGEWWRDDQLMDKSVCNREMGGITSGMCGTVSIFARQKRKGREGRCLPRPQGSQQERG